MTDRYLIVGLGNPGTKYAQTRHNIGFKVVDELARRYAMTFGKTERKAVTADGIIHEKRVLIAKPQTYMNASGEAVRSLVDFYKIDIKNLLIIHDELDIPFATLRIRASGSAGGQNGVKSIIQHLGTKDFTRIRCGIGRPPGRMNPADYVLTPFKGNDLITARLLLERAAAAAEEWLTNGTELAMTRFNGSIEEKSI